MFNKKNSQNRNWKHDDREGSGYESSRFNPRDTNRYENPRSYGDVWEQERRNDRDFGGGRDRDYGREPSRYGREFREEGDYGQNAPTGSANFEGSYDRESDGYRSRDFGNPDYANQEYGTQGSRGLGYGSHNPNVGFRNRGSQGYYGSANGRDFSSENLNRNETYRAGSYGSHYNSSFGQTSGNRGKHFGKGPKNYRRSDERLRDEVNDCLWQAPEIDASEIDVTVENGVVTLMGTVEDRQCRREAEMAIENIPGVLDVKNQLTVELGSTGYGSMPGRSGKPDKSETPTGKGFESAKSKSSTTGKSATDMM